MPFFQELEIIRNDVNSRNTSGYFNRPVDDRTTGNSQYNVNTLQFPLDIGAADKGHYLMFNINAQINTQFSKDFTGENATVVKNMQQLQSRRGGSTNLINQELLNSAGNLISLVAAGSQLVNNVIPSALTSFLPKPDIAKGLETFGNDVKKAANSSEQFLRTVKRTTDTVVLYMPDKITYNNAQNYGEISLGGEVVSLAGLSAAATSAKQSPENLATFAAFAASEKSPIAKKELNALATAITQVVKNPMLEVMYKGVSLRKFNFSFSLWPRSEQEAIEVQKIIELLRYHQAPEIKPNTGGFFLIPPSEFDISFMYNGKTNPNMDAISTCVLTNVAVDYTPKGFHAFESIGSIDNPQLGKTGMPVGINLSLSFMETQIITKEYYRNNDGSKSSNQP